MTHYSDITPELEFLTSEYVGNNYIPTSFYKKYSVYRGLRDQKGKGVLTGLTDISTVNGMREIDGVRVPIEGELKYRGYNVQDLIKGCTQDGRYGFEEVTYLLIFGQLPSPQELSDFTALLASYRTLPTNFVRDVIMKAPSSNMMNGLQRGVLTLYGYDEKADDISIANVLRQCLQLISTTPMMAVYSYRAYRHYIQGHSLYIHAPKPELSTAQNILRILRNNKSYSDLEARILDVALILHMEHGGGNNSTFTNRVVTSSGTDTYSAMAAALGSLKGPKHGGANLKVNYMFDDMKEHVTNWEDESMILDYLNKLLNKEAFDRAGLIYGIGHAVYSISDPRAVIFKGYVEALAQEKDCMDEFYFYDRVERLAVQLVSEKRNTFKGVCANLDFWSGFMYRMLNLPVELFTPMFATARMVGWSAHRLEELLNCDKIIRPAYQSVSVDRDYVPMKDR